MPPLPRETPLQGDWTPFRNEVQFKVADLIYRHAELSASNIDALLDLQAESFKEFDASQHAPFENHQDLYSTIDSSTLGDIPWQCLVTEVSDNINERSPNWMQEHYEVWYCDPEAVVTACCRTQISMDNSIYAPILTLTDMESVDRTTSCREILPGGVL